MSKTALILGIGGMDGSHLADHLLEKGYTVHGTYRRSSVDNLYRIRHALNRIVLHPADLADGQSIEQAINSSLPDEIYNEADQDHVGFSRSTPQVSIDITAGAVQRLLESVRKVVPKCRVFQPLSATMFGKPCNGEDTLNVRSELHPASPYACAKVAAWYLCKHYRREHGIDVRCGILFNHESPRRGPDYLLQRIVREAKISIATNTKMKFSNLDMKVDIGYAPEYMDAAYRIMQLDKPDDFVVGTGIGVSIRSIIATALDDWTEDDIEYHVKEVPGYSNEPTLIADYSKLNRLTGWAPQTSMRELINIISHGVK